MGKLSFIDSSCASVNGENFLREQRLGSSAVTDVLSRGLPDVSWAEEAPPKQGKPQKPWAGSSEAHTAALLPGSRAVTGNWGWLLQLEGGDPIWSIPALPESQSTRLPPAAPGDRW